MGRDFSPNLPAHVRMILTMASSATRMPDVTDADYRMSFMELVCASLQLSYVRDAEVQCFFESLVSVSNGDLGYVCDISDFLLRLLFTLQDTCDVE